MAFEQLRLKVDRSGRSPRAFMLTCGTLAMARARSQFACNFFACAGIRVVDNTFFHSVEEGAKAALDSGAEIVVICAADDDYATLAPKAKEPARRTGTLRRGRCTSIAARTRSAGHHPLHQRKEQRTRNPQGIR